MPVKRLISTKVLSNARFLLMSVTTPCHKHSARPHDKSPPCWPEHINVHCHHSWFTTTSASRKTKADRTAGWRSTAVLFFHIHFYCNCYLQTQILHYLLDNFPPPLDVFIPYQPPLSSLFWIGVGILWVVVALVWRFFPWWICLNWFFFFLISLLLLQKVSKGGLCSFCWSSALSPLPIFIFQISHPSISISTDSSNN